MIEIKTFFNDWREVSREKAEEYIKLVISGAQAMPHAEIIKFIEEKRLRGITVEELLYKK